MFVFLILLMICHMTMTFVLYYISRDINDNIIDLEKSINGLYRRRKK